MATQRPETGASPIMNAAPDEQVSRSDQTATAVATEPSRLVPSETMSPWNVILLDDDEHSPDYVVRMMRSIFGYVEERGYQIAKEVDSQGRAICLTTHKELAELKRDQMLSFGRDPIIASCKGSMSAVIEPAEG